MSDRRSSGFGEPLSNLSLNELFDLRTAYRRDIGTLIRADPSSPQISELDLEIQRINRQIERVENTIDVDTPDTPAEEPERLRQLEPIAETTEEQVVSENEEDEPDEFEGEPISDLELANLDIMANANVAVTGGQLHIVPEYDGTKDIVSFLLQIDRYKAQFNWSQQGTAAAVKTKLTGLAATWLRTQEKRNVEGLDQWENYTVPVADGNDRTVTALRSLLNARFGQKVSQQAASEAVQDLKQKATERVDDFFDRCYLAADKIFHNIPAAQRREEQMQRAIMATVGTLFSAGLRDVYKQRVTGGPNPPETADALLEACRTVEIEVSKRHVDEISLSSSTTATETGYADGETTDALPSKQERDEDVAELRREIAALKFGSRANIRCYKCDGWGHTSPECPSGPNRRGRGRGRSRGRGRGWTRGRGRGNGYQTGRGRGRSQQQYGNPGFNPYRNNQGQTSNEITWDMSGNE